ncbi:MAG: hypothetical protein ACRDO7_08835 [Nocardioidaceae bacterium]
MAEVEELLKTQELQQVAGGQANGDSLLQRANRAVASASEIVGTDPTSAYVLAYDAARHAGTALLAHQGLRPTRKGGHTTPSSVHYEPSSLTASGRLGRCVVVAMSWSTPRLPIRRPTTMRLAARSRTHKK